MASSPPSLQFGIEVELLIRPKQQSNLMKALRDYGFNPNAATESQNVANRTAVRQVLANRLTARGVDAALSAGQYGAWTIADEVSLEEQQGYWRCEIVSRILKTDESWQTEIDNMFRILRDNFDVMLTTGCSMHVHVSPSSGRYNVQQVRRIVKGIIYYDRALTTIMPRLRKQNPWAESNVRATVDWQRKFNEVSQNSWAPLFNPLHQSNMTAGVLQDLCNNRYVAWNFSNVVSGCGTIEFRRPPGVETSADARHWVAVTLGFVFHSMELKNWDQVRLTNTYPTTSHLRNAITSGINSLGGRCAGSLRQMPDILGSPIVPTHSELLRIRQKQKEKAGKKSVFAEKVINSRPNTPTGLK